MKQKTEAVDDDPLDREIDFSNARRNPYARDFYKSKNLRILAPDLLELFPDSESVNEALRAVAAIAVRAANPPETVSPKRVAVPKIRRKTRTKLT